MKEKHYTPKKYEELNFTDDFLFGKILYSSPDICRELLEYIKSGNPGKSRPALAIDEKVQMARENEIWGNEYMTTEERVRQLMETDLAEAREEAKAEGHAE